MRTPMMPPRRLAQVLEAAARKARGGRLPSPGAKVKGWLANAAILTVSAVLTLLVLEHTVFRFVLVPDDVLANRSVNGVVRYVPDTRAVFRHPDGRETVVTTNAQGWNSTKPAYSTERKPGVARVAVVGDSYVHGSFVNVDQGFPELLEKRLAEHGVKAEVLRFGMDGAPLSQYLHMLRKEVSAYRPDLVLIPLIHNDFDESYRSLKTRYASSFLKVVQEPSGRFIEVPPAEFRPGSADVLRNSRMFRYLYYKTGLYLSMKSWTSRLFWGGDEDWSPEFVSSAVDIRKINDHPKNKSVARYVMREIQALGDREGFAVAFLMDGVREAVYSNRSPMDYEVGRLNRIAQELTTELDLPFLDLHTTFSEDYARNRQKFEFAYDWHWNERGNALVAEAATTFLLSEPNLAAALVKAQRDHKSTSQPDGRAVNQGRLLQRPIRTPIPGTRSWSRHATAQQD